MQPLVRPQRIGALSRILPVHAPSSEWHCFPNLPLETSAAKVSNEPVLPNAAGRSNDCHNASGLLSKQLCLEALIF
jgi:hypothetical protein